MIRSILSKGLIKVREAREHKDRLYPTHSSCHITFSRYKKLYGKCMRAAYYSCIGIEEKEELTLESELIKLMGKYVEKALVDTFAKEGVLKKKSVSFNIDKYKITGEVDAIITKDGLDYGVEIKSIGGNNTYANSLIFTNGNPKWQNLFQTLVYCYAFKDILPNGFILFYIRRDTGEVREFNVRIEPYNGSYVPVIDGKMDFRYTVDDILKRYSLLNKFITEGKVPPKEYMQIYPSELIPSYYTSGILSKKQVDAYNIKPFGDIECKFCGYKNVCEGDK